MSIWDWLKNWWHPEPPAPPLQPPSVVGIVEAVNRVRAKQWLSAFIENPILAGAAAAQAEYCADLGRLTHAWPFESTLFTRASAAGYQGSSGEVLAAGQQTPDEAVQAWLSDPAHAGIILSRTYTEAGGAVATGRDGMLYWCLDVGSPA